MIHKVVIIGAGCAGLTAGIYCGRAMLNPLIFAGDLDHKGGMLMKTTTVENYPGFPEGVNGYELIQNMENQALKCGSKIVDETVLEVDFTSKPFKLTTDTGKVYKSLTVIICTGSEPNKLNIENEQNLWTKGISSCAVCDGALYKNKNIMVVGGGDSAMEEALFLTKFSKVMLVHRGNSFRASKIMAERVLNNQNIKIFYNTTIDKLYGTDKLHSVLIKNSVTGINQKIDVDGLFYGLGSNPNTLIFKKYLDMDDKGYIRRYRKMGPTYKTSTSVPGVFVAGDSCDKNYRQAVVACGDGCKAAIDVEKYLENMES